jgi:hypothetical protein
MPPPTAPARTPFAGLEKEVALVETALGSPPRRPPAVLEEHRAGMERAAREAGLFCATPSTN